MHWSWCLLPTAVLVAANVGAQPKPTPKPGDQPDGWKPLDAEPDTPDPVPAPTPPKPTDESPYRPAPTPPPEPRPRAPRPDGAPPSQEVVANDSASTLPESILWMKQWKPRFAVRQVRAEFDVWSHAAGTSYMWNIVMALGVEDVPVLLDVELPFTHIDIEPNGIDPETGDPLNAHTHFGNATLGLHGGGVIKNAVGLWGGAWVSIPSAKDISAVDGLTLLPAAYSRNFVEAYRFFPDSIPLRWAFGIDGQVFPLVYLRSTLYTVLYFPNQELAGSFTIPAIVEQIHEAEVLSPVGVGGGLRFQSVFNLSNASFGDGLHAIEPFISYQPPYEGPYALDLFARLGVLIGLNEPTFGTPIGDVVTMKSEIGYRF